jgi:hypothetical protein
MTMLAEFADNRLAPQRPLGFVRAEHRTSKFVASKLPNSAAKFITESARPVWLAPCGSIVTFDTVCSQGASQAQVRYQRQSQDRGLINAKAECRGLFGACDGERPSQGRTR